MIIGASLDAVRLNMCSIYLIGIVGMDEYSP